MTQDLRLVITCVPYHGIYFTYTYLRPSCHPSTHTGTVELHGLSSSSYPGQIYGVPPHNRCNISGTDDGKMGYGYVKTEKGEVSSIVMCYNNGGGNMEWRAVGGETTLSQ